MKKSVIVEDDQSACDDFSVKGCFTVSHEIEIERRCDHSASHTWGRWVCGKCAQREALKIGGVLIPEEEVTA